MFIKIIKDGKNYRESTFECIRYSMWDLGDRDEPTVMLEIRGEYDTDIEVVKSTDILYILNSHGKTIDTYKWT